VRRPSGKRATTFGRKSDPPRGRELVLLLGGAIMAARILRVHRKAMPVIGLLGSTSPGPNAANMAAFRQGLREIGYVEGKNVAIEYRWAEGHPDRLPALAVDLVCRKVDVIIAMGGTPLGAGGEKRNLNDPDRLSRLTQSRPAASPVSRDQPAT
jgi:putative ABC transport system substrate-binding protein